MTPEAALTKLSYVLGKADWSTEKRRKVKNILLYAPNILLEVAINDNFPWNYMQVGKISLCILGSLFQVIQENIRGEKRQIISQRGTDETLLELPLLEKLRETLKISSSEVCRQVIIPSQIKKIRTAVTIKFLNHYKFMHQN